MLFAGLALTYVGLSPLQVSQMGYMPENVLGARDILHDIGCLFHRGWALTPVSIPRHGLLESAFETPFLWVGHVFGGAWSERVLSLEPVLATALIGAVVFAWLRRLGCEPFPAYLLTIAMGFTTMLWPYAYIGLETTQSASLILAAYLSLASTRRTGAITVSFAFLAGTAVSVKAGGFLLAPGVGSLIWRYCSGATSRWRRLGFVTGVASILFGLNHYLQTVSKVYGPAGGVQTGLNSIVGPLRMAGNLWSLFTSLNKGLFLYCPVIILAALLMPLALKHNRRIAIFALLVLGGLAIGSSAFFFWSDETWGPRYLHAAVAPLVMCIGAALPSLELSRWKRIAFSVCFIWGLALSFLGVFFWYHSLHMAAMASQSLTLEQLQYDVEWNPVRFDAQLMDVWLRNSALGQNRDEPWPPTGHPWSWNPPGEPLSRPVNLRLYARPQPFLIASWRRWQTRSELVCWVACLLSLIGGAALLARGCLLALRHKLPGSSQRSAVSD